MISNPQFWITVVTALGAGGLFTSVVGWLKDRKKSVSETNKTDVDTRLAYLNTVIERLDEEATRVQAERDAEAKRHIAERDALRAEIISIRAQMGAELSEERNRSAEQRKIVRQLEDELDSVRRSARETQHKCDELATKLKQLVGNAQQGEAA